MIKDLTFHYTNEKMVKDLLKLISFEKDDVVLDAGSGKNKVWQENCPVKCLECEIEDGCDFFNWNKKVDWVIGNPPFRDNAEDGKRINLVPQFIFKASEISNKGFAFLINAKSFALFTTSRLQKLKEVEFEMTKLHIVADKRWFGRYYFIVFEKKKGILTWERKTY